MKKTFTVTIDGPGLVLASIAAVGSLLAVGHHMNQQRDIKLLTSELELAQEHNRILNR